MVYSCGSAEGILMNGNVDLRQLAVRGNGSSSAPPGRRRWRFVSRYAVPAALLAGFLAVVGWAARDAWLPATPVTVVPVLSIRGEVQTGGAPLFQAAGWVEPRPTPVYVTALTEGVIEQLLVVEGQQVAAGEVVARLIDADARLAVTGAEADVKLRKAEAAAAEAALEAARTNSAKPVHLAMALAEAEAALAQKETEAGMVPFQLKAAEARLELAQTTYDNLSKAWSSGSLSLARWLQADNDLKTATLTVAELKARGPLLECEVKALAARRAALSTRLELKTEETRQLGEATAQVDAAQARLQQAQAALAAARLRLERTAVRAPVAGRVLSLVARPGMRLMGLSPASLHDSSTVVTLYDPAQLQVRVDVRLEDVPRVQPGQAVRLETPAAPGGPLEGTVLFITSQADIQKNTVQVKVAVKTPPATLRPDMLVQATFLAVAAPGPGGAMAAMRLLIPRKLVENADGTARVWLADQAASVARLRAVKLGVAAGDLVEVVEGLTAADRLIAGGQAGLRDGQRITVVGEDAAGLESSPGTGPAPPAGGHHGKH
jgi:RND family efflux transporter MFP subunit